MEISSSTCARGNVPYPAKDVHGRPDSGDAFDAQTGIRERVHQLLLFGDVFEYGISIDS